MTATTATAAASSRATIGAAIATTCVALLFYRHYRNHKQIQQNNNRNKSPPSTPQSKSAKKRQKQSTAKRRRDAQKKKLKKIMAKNQSLEAIPIDVETFAFPTRPKCPICDVVLPLRQSQCTYLLCCGTAICRACNGEAYDAVAEVKEEQEEEEEKKTETTEDGEIHVILTEIDDDEETNANLKLRQGSCCRFCLHPAPQVHTLLPLLQERSDTDLDPNAMHILSGMYLEGNGVPRDEGRGIRLCQQASDGGNINAAHELAIYCADGHHGLTPDVERARRLLTRSAKLGNVASLTALGQLEAQGGHVTLAFQYWLIAARAGEDAAMDNCRQGFASKLITKEQYGAALRCYQASQAETRSEKRDALIEAEKADLRKMKGAAAPNSPRSIIS